MRLPVSCLSVLFIGAIGSSVDMAGQAVTEVDRFETRSVSRDLHISAPPQIRFVQERVAALVGRPTNLELTINPPLPVKSSLALQSSDLQVVQTATVPMDVPPNQSVMTVTVWAVQATDTPVTVRAILLLDSTTEISATIVLDLLNPRPVVKGIDPTSAHAGSRGITLLVIGSLFVESTFVSNSVAYWNGSPRPTRLAPLNLCHELCVELLYVSVTEADLAFPGMATLSVVNPPPGGGVSNEVTFQIAAPSLGRPKTPTQTVTFHDRLTKKPIGPRP